MPAPQSYSRTQIILHWTIAVLVLVQFLFHDVIEDVWDDRMDGDIANVPSPNPHALIGLIILALVVWRIVVRLRRGAPPPPEGQNRAITLVATGTHFLLYALLILMPLSGATAWFAGIEAPAEAHEVLKTVLLIVVSLHILGALAEHFVFRTNVLMRMLGMA